MPSVYKHLTQSKDTKLKSCIEIKFRCEALCSKLWVSPSTLSRELRRNKGEIGYKHKQAQSKYQERNSRQGKALKFKGEMLSIVEN